MKISGLTFAASLALVGCADSSATEPSKSAPAATQASNPAAAPGSGPDAKQAAGKSIEGSGYSFVVPEGWAIPEDGAAQEGVDVLAANLADTDGFADNVNVVVSPAGEVTPEQVESKGVKELENAGAKDVTARDRVTVGDWESAHLSAVFPHDADEYLIDQFYVSHDKQTYIVTFSFSPTVAEADRDDVSSSVLATWTWV